MADTTFELDEIPGVTFTASFGSGGQTGLPSNWVRIVGTVDNPYYEPGYNYGLDPDGFTEVTDPWRRHTDVVEVCAMGFAGPAGSGLPADPPPAPAPAPETTPEEV
ncbi:hypothetical protein SEA_DMITRI_29 [Gordonia phage Dmitri]|nr:hypothetical protein SEA_DMITRI_29 [Gordonia phage Dmitri]